MKEALIFKFRVLFDNVISIYSQKIAKNAHQKSLF